MLLRKNNRLLYLASIALFIISACYGLLIRWNFTFPISSFSYQNVLQSHSHVAFLGWGYMACIGAIMSCFISKINQNRKIYKITLSIIFITILLMLISFPLSGYKAFSIVLLSIFGITSYVLSYRLLKDINGKNIAVKLIKYGIYYYLLSSLATWFLAGVLLTEGRTTLYYNTIYFYLHFLYNGFFVFALYGLLFRIFEKQQIHVSEKLQKGFFIYLNVACIPAYALSVLWSDVSSIYHVIGFAASILQFISLFFLIKIIQKSLPQIKWAAISKLLLKFSLIAYSLKVILQVASAFPYFVEKSLALKPYFIIGYLHLFTLAFMSVLLLLLLNQLGKIDLKSTISKVGLGAFLMGIFLTEALLFLQGFLFLIQSNAIENYNIWLLIFSFLMVVGLVVFFIKQLFRNSRTLN